MSLPVQGADHSQRDAIAQVLCEAFAKDPIIGWILPEARNTETARTGLFREAAHMYLRDGLVETTAGLGAVALWGRPQPPRRHRVGRWLDDARALISTFRAAGTSLGRAIQLHQTMLRHHPREPHWYLSAIGTRVEERGRGAASSLLTERLAVCDATGALAYLESSNEANLALYQRHGFEIGQKLFVADDSPPLWPMRREPRG